MFLSDLLANHYGAEISVIWLLILITYQGKKTLRSREISMLTLFEIHFRSLFLDFKKRRQCSEVTGGRGVGGQFDPSPLWFSKNVSSKERVKPWFFVTFNIILRHMFPENFIEFPQVVQKIWRNSLSILANFHQFFGFFDITLLQRN